MLGLLHYTVEWLEWVVLIREEAEVWEVKVRWVCECEGWPGLG